MIDEHLIAGRAVCGGAQHDAGIGRPVRPRLELEFEIAERGLADEIGAEAAARRVLPSADRAVLDRPAPEMAERLPIGVGVGG